MLSPERRQQPGLRLWSYLHVTACWKQKLNVACGVGQVDRGTSPKQVGVHLPGRTQDGLPLDPSLRESERLSATYTVTGRRLLNSLKASSQTTLSVCPRIKEALVIRIKHALACALNSYRVP